MIASRISPTDVLATALYYNPTTEDRKAPGLEAETLDTFLTIYKLYLCCMHKPNRMVVFSFDVLCIDSIVDVLDFAVLTRTRVDIVAVMFIAAMVDILMVDILDGKSTDSLLRAGADVLVNVNFNACFGHVSRYWFPITKKLDVYCSR